MTTLPQTTGIRLPRPVGGGGPAGAGMQLSHGGGAPVATGLTGGDIWRVLRANMWLIVILVVTAGVLGFFVNWFLAKNHSRFTAFAYVQVDPKTSNAWIGKNGQSEWQDWNGMMIQQR